MIRWPRPLQQPLGSHGTNPASCLGRARSNRGEGGHRAGRPGGVRTLCLVGMRPPSGTVTFLFTDIEGSTRRWEADPEAMRAALALHDEVLRSAIEAHGGWLFKHTGDGVCAAFGSARAAVDAAVAAQQALGLPARMGIQPVRPSVAGRTTSVRC